MQQAVAKIEGYVGYLLGYMLTVILMGYQKITS